MRGSLVLLAVALLLAPARAGQQSAPAAGQKPGDDLAIIVHRSNTVDGLSLRELRRIFMLDVQTWSFGRKITVVLRDKGQPERTEAIRLICGVTEEQYDRHLLEQTFKGAIARAPRGIASAAAMLRFVFNAPGAIGYVWADEHDGSAKVLRIDGLMPGDAGYPLRRQARRPGSGGN